MSAQFLVNVRMRENRMRAGMTRSRKSLPTQMLHASASSVEAEEGEHGRKRSLHSFRNTFARVTLEVGTPIAWVSRQLGHSSIVLTVNTYGHWSRDAERAQAKALDGAFNV
jgi:integrase